MHLFSQSNHVCVVAFLNTQMQIASRAWLIAQRELTMTHPLWRRPIASKACYIAIALVEVRCNTLSDVTMLPLTACGPGMQVAKRPRLLSDQFTKGALARRAPFGSRQLLRASHSRANICSVHNIHSPTLTEFAKGSLKRCSSLLVACLLTGLLSVCPVQADATITDTIQSSNLVVRHAECPRLHLEGALFVGIAKACFVSCSWT